MNHYLGKGASISIRQIQTQDLKQIAPHGYSVSITEPLTDIEHLQACHNDTGLWQTESGAVGIIENTTERLVGTCQFFRSGPCIHGLEIGYVVHSEADRGKGYASEALSLLSNYLFEVREQYHRLQLTIATSNIASSRVAEKCEYVQEGILRKSGFPPESPADCFIYSKIRADNS